MPAVIAPILTGAFGISAGAASTITSLALYAGVSAASILLQQSMVPNQKQEMGTKLSAVLGGAVNQSITVGRKETAGSFLYINSWGTAGKVPNAFLTRVYCLGDRPVAGFENYIWAGGRKCSYDPDETQTIGLVNVGHPISAFKSNGQNRLWVKFYDGSQSNADGYLTAKFGDDPNRPWTSDHVGRGRPYMIVTQKYDKKQPSGQVDIIAIVKDAKLYDWRDDSTNGGSGSQRYGDYSTYGIDPGSPVVTIYNVMRGIYRNNEWLYGGQSWPASRFDVDTWTAAANKCDENVAVAGGGTQKRYRMGAEFDLSEEPWTVIERCLRACNGRIVESGGVFKIYTGGIGGSVYSFDDDDILATEELTGRLFPARESIANTVTGTYVEPDSSGEPKAFKARFKQSYIDEDGDDRKTSIDFEYVRDNRQAQRLATLALNDNRRFRTFVLALWTQARKLEPGDVVTWTSARFGFSSKKFIVGNVILRHDGVVILNLREADNSDSDWDTSYEDPYESGYFADINPPPQSISAIVTSVPFTDDDDRPRRPAIRIRAALDDDYVDCRALRYQVRKRFGDQKIVHRDRSRGFFEEDSEDYGDITFTSNAIAALKGKQVQVRYKIDPESDRETVWSEWADHTITLGNYGIDDDDTDSSVLVGPTSLQLAKVQTADNDGTVRTFVKMTCTPPGWAGAKATYEWRIVVDGDDTYIVKSGDPKKRFRVQKTGVLHTVQVRCVKGTGNKSAWSSSAPITPTKKTAPPTTVTGLTVDARAKANVLTWTRSSDPDIKEYAIYRSTANNFGTATLIARTSGTKYRDDDNLTKGVTYHYWVVPVDTTDNPGTQSASSNGGEYKLIALTDTDEAVLAAPGGVSLSQANRDVDLDGTVDIALLGTFSGGVSGAADYEFEISSSTTSGGTYTVIATTASPTGKVWFNANTQLYYKARARAISFNGTKGDWSSLTSAVNPAGTAGAPANPTGFFATAATYGFLLWWGKPAEKDYSHTEIAYLSSAGTPGDSNVVHSSASPFTMLFWPYGNDAYFYARHVNTSGLKSGWVLNSMGALSANLVGYSDLAASAYNNVSSQNNVNTVEAYGTFATGDQEIQTLTVNHGANARHVLVMGSCRVTAAGDPFSLWLETGAGSVISSMPGAVVSANDYMYVFGILGAPAGASTTVEMHIQFSSGSGHNVANRRIVALSMQGK